MNRLNLSWLFAIFAVVALAGCAQPEKRSRGETLDRITSEIDQGARDRRAATPKAVEQALLPTAVAEAPAPAPEPRFDLIVNGAPAQQVFTAIVTGTRYSMLLPPELSGSITVSLKNVTVREALDALRELYGYEYRIQGNRIHVQPNTLQSRIFQINYLAGRRQGVTDISVSSGSISRAVTAGGQGGGATPAPAPGASGSGSGAATQTRHAIESSRISTSHTADFWEELNKALQTIVGTEGGRNVIVNPISGVVLVRAYPGELRNVEHYLRSTQLIVERQVMIEAKIVEVSLKDEFQSGINWSTFNGSNNRFSFGVAQPGTVLRTQPGEALSGLPPDTIDATARIDEMYSSAGTILPGKGGLLAAAALGKGFFGLAFQAANFAALLNFLESQGTTQVLSSPRIATLNNQKAVLKVGTDEFFVTNISTTTTTTGTTNTVSPTITVEPFFSGIALDVTPQIDENENITLHIRPSISAVSEKQKTLNLGSLGVFTLPLASSNVSETDSVVRVQDSNIVAIGGLMKQEQSAGADGLPGVSSFPLFGQKGRAFRKREIVILLKPTIIRSDASWQKDLGEIGERMRDYAPPPPASPSAQ
ncbi:MAG: secretin N-terminal domain-containing protein [Rhodocyclaceae bacterium]|jgi:MSHA biogenesis protein MshL|nr:secretin N-terminal domain-containing protein [Rhodocyclaceae bacterium]